MRSDGTLASAWAIGGVLVFALVLRVVFYTGFFGSDEVTYVESAFKLLDGDWRVSTYVGANRYGMNLPIAAFAAVFGRNEWSAAAYSMLCSIVEVALVAWMGKRLVGERAALLAALVLACLPTHVHLAGRLMADSPLALTITASFFFFFDGEARQSRLSYFIAGCAAGFSFWIKQATAFYLLVFLLYPLLFWRLERRWVWMVLGFSAVILINCLLFLALTGDALFIFKVMTSRQASGYLDAEAQRGSLADSPLTYPTLLFVKVHHTWLLGYLAILGVVAWIVQKLRDSALVSALGIGHVAFWAIGLLGVMSLLPIAWKPLMFVPKQTNYMLMFVPPLCLLAGYFLAQLHGVVLRVHLALIIVPSIMLAGLHQSIVHVFTSNSKAAVQFVIANPQARIFANASPYRAGTFHNLVLPNEHAVLIGSMGDLATLHAPPSTALFQQHSVLVILDQMTLDWASDEPIRRLEDVPSCWRLYSTLQPLGFGLGWYLHGNLIGALEKLPQSLSQESANRLRTLYTPARAMVFDWSPACE